MTLAVTGATGHLGRLVISSLIERGTAPASIVAIVRDSAKAQPLADLGVHVRVAAYDNAEGLVAALEGIDRLLLISSSEVGKRFEQHKTVIDAAVTAGVSAIVYTSAPRATTSALILAPEHKATEEYLDAAGITHTIVRNGWYTENYANTLATARETGTIVAAAGEGRVASASRIDYAEGTAVALADTAHDGKVYELAGDVAWNYNDLAAAVGSIIGREVTYQSVTPDELTASLLAAGLDEGTAGFVAALDADTAKGYLALSTGDLQSLIGRPTTPLRAGLAAAATE